ncbi:uncharacterized protein LOC128721477 [Anopheles nili]|uniref:uncharacterized protein LOC128721477 n=1 Tax=Anopheles nili TaxID=185578 RepID=UPI00237A9143|nr:uncharacterized protein LOC128721477 [Anopheles nili]
MQLLNLLFALLLSASSTQAFWWSTNQSSDPPVASKQVQYVRAFTYQPVAFPAHSLLAPPSPYKFIQASPAAIMPTAKQVAPVQPTSQPVPQQPVPPQSASPFSSFFGSAFGGMGQSFGSGSATGHPNSVSVGGSVPAYQPQHQQQHPQVQQVQQVQQAQQQQQQQQQQQVVQAPSPSMSSVNPSQSDVSGPGSPGVGFYGQQHPSKYPYFTMDQVQYLSSLPASAPHTPQVQFVPCMCPIAVNVQSHAELADKRLDETTTTDSEVVVPSAESEK